MLVIEIYIEAVFGGYGLVDARLQIVVIVRIRADQLKVIPGARERSAAECSWSKPSAALLWGASKIAGESYCPWRKGSTPVESVMITGVIDNR